MADLDEGTAVARLLRRTGFTASAGTADRYAHDGFAATVDAVLGTPGHDAGAAATPPPRFAALHRPAKAQRGDKTARRAYAQQARQQLAELRTWWLDRMVAAAHPWTEKRTLLWHGHWATSFAKVRSPAALLAQNETERTLGGGDFRDLARAMVRDPALMIWLDAQKNRAKAPNENLGRELMELFVLGVGHYDESDVREAARALTGWRLDRRSDPPAARYVPRQHEPGTQTVLGKTAAFTAQTLIDHLVDQPASPRYLATRMWHWLVSAADPSDASLDRIVAAYGTGRDLTAMFRALLTDPAFRTADAVVVKQPVELVVGAMRALHVRPAKLAERPRRQLLGGLQALGQQPFEPPSVGGWPTGAAWLTTAAARARLQVGLGLARAADLGEVERASRTERVDVVTARLGVPAWTDRTRTVLDDAAGQPAELVGLALASPEYAVNP